MADERLHSACLHRRPGQVGQSHGVVSQGEVVDESSEHGDRELRHVPNEDNFEGASSTLPYFTLTRFRRTPRSSGDQR